jgi:hypothetical protein
VDVGERVVDEDISEPVPEDKLAANFERSMPPERFIFGSTIQEEMIPAQKIKIKSSKAKKRIVKPMLIPHHCLCKGRIWHDSRIISTV